MTMTLTSNSYGNAAAASGYQPPLAEVVPWAYIGFFGTEYGTDCLTRNLADDQPDATVIGAPTLGATYADMKGALNYLQLGLEHGEAMTFIAVAAPLADSAGGAVISNNGSISQVIEGEETSRGAMLYFRAGAATDDGSVRPSFQQARVVADVSDVSGNLAQGAETLQVDFPAILVGRTAVGVPPSIWDMTHDAAATQGAIAIDVADLGQEFRIGSQYGAGVDDAVRVYAVFVAPVRLTDAQLQEEVYPRLTAHFLRRGIDLRRAG